MRSELSIYYATMTGNTEELARNAEGQTRAAGFTPFLYNLSEASPQSILERERALFIVSTWGDGDPPDDAEEFFEELLDANIDMSGFNYAVLGLGDSSYPEFNAFAKNLATRLEELGAKSIHPLIEADIDYDDTYDEWIQRILPLLQQPEPLPAK